MFALFVVSFGFGKIQAQLPHTIDLHDGEEDVRILGDDEEGLSGQAVASGVYFYRMMAGYFTATKRMVLLK